MASGERQDEVRRVLRRAVELERERASDEPETDVDEIAREVGLERAAITRRSPSRALGRSTRSPTPRSSTG
jgi:hypothetical protein